MALERLLGSDDGRHADRFLGQTRLSFNSSDVLFNDRELKTKLWSEFTSSSGKSGEPTTTTIITIIIIIVMMMIIITLIIFIFVIVIIVVVNYTICSRNGLKCTCNCKCCVLFKCFLLILQLITTHLLQCLKGRGDPSPCRVSMGGRCGTQRES